MNNENIVGLDVGTMWLVSAKQTSGTNVELNKLRNMYVEIDPTAVSKAELENANLDFITQEEDGEEKNFVISEDAFRFCQIFNQEPKRPMSNGVISVNEIDAIDIIALMVKNLVGDKKGGYCVYSVPAAAADVEIPPVFYHERVFGKILDSLGYESKALNEGLAVVFANCQEEKFSGIGISFGCGLTNVAVSYRGISKLQFSVSRGGDWVDESAAHALGVSTPKVTSIKERKLNLLDLSNFTNKKEKRIAEALQFSYQNLIKYVINAICKKVEEEAEDFNVDESIPIVVSGGTSMPPGFIDIFKETISKYKNFPYDVSEVRHAKDPLNSVAIGCLVSALTNKTDDVKQQPKKEKKNEEEA